MIEFTAADRVDPPFDADEATTLLGFLRYQRDTLRWKCSGLTDEQLSRRLPTSALSLGGIVKHLAVVEAGWLNLRFTGGTVRPSWFADMDHDDDEWSFTSADGATAEQLFAWYDESIAVSDQVVRDALATPEGLGSLSIDEGDGGPRPSLRWILCHLIEEYARHNGHADLVREAIDGSVGE
jgi:uncharacterized damage-inducible protein DinB